MMPAVDTRKFSDIFIDQRCVYILLYGILGGGGGGGGFMEDEEEEG